MDQHATPERPRIVEMTRDPPLEFVHELFNHPASLAYHGMQYIDVSTLYDFPENHVIANENGGTLFRVHTPDNCEIHYLLAPGVRGKQALTTCRDALTLAWSCLPVSRMVGLITLDNLPAQRMTALLGFSRRGKAHDRDGRICVKYVMEKPHGR